MTSINRTSSKMKMACVELESALKNFEKQQPQVDRYAETQSKLDEMKQNIKFIKEQLDALSK